MRLGVVIPLANEEATLDEFLSRVLEQLGRDDGVFCVVDNASRDATREMVESYSQRDPRVALVWAPLNRCVVDAYFSGYRAALDGSCRWILEMDGGLSHSPEQIPMFLRAMEAGYDYVGGCRFMAGGSYSGPWSRYFVSWGGGMLARFVLGARMRDMTSGFECFTREALLEVLDRGVRSRAHFFQTEIKYLMHSWRWTEVPIHYRNPSKSLSRGSLLDAWRNLWELRRTRRSKPRRLNANPTRRAA